MSDFADAAQALRIDLRRRLLPTPLEAQIAEALAEICASITTLSKAIEDGSNPELSPLFNAQVRAAGHLFDLLSDEAMVPDRHRATAAWAAYRAAAEREAA